jgi:hypothetical protein
MTATPGALPNGPMDRDFIVRNQIVERYLAGRLPPKAISDFERFVRENPALIDELKLADRVNAGLKLLEAAGDAEPWAQAPLKVWQKLPFVAGAAGAAAVLLVATLVLVASNSDQSGQIAKLKKEVAERPLTPAQRTRTVIVKPASYSPQASMLTISPGEMADLKIELSQTSYSLFRVTIERVDQGRVAVLDNMLKDSNKHLRLQVNPSALGPGDYVMEIEGLNMRREALALAWVRFTIGR